MPLQELRVPSDTLRLAALLITVVDVGDALPVVLKPVIAVLEQRIAAVVAEVGGFLQPVEDLPELLLVDRYLDHDVGLFPAGTIM